MYECVRHYNKHACNNTYIYCWCHCHCQYVSMWNDCFAVHYVWFNCECFIIMIVVHTQKKNFSLLSLNSIAVAIACMHAVLHYKIIYSASFFRCVRITFFDLFVLCLSHSHLVESKCDTADCCMETLTLNVILLHFYVLSIVKYQFGNERVFTPLATTTTTTTDNE